MDSLNSRLGWGLRSFTWDALIHRPGMASFRELNFPRIWRIGTREFPNNNAVREAIWRAMIRETTETT